MATPMAFAPKRESLVHPRGIHRGLRFRGNGERAGSHSGSA